MRLLAALCAGLACTACLASPTTFVLTQTQRRSEFDRYLARFAPLPDDPELDAGLKSEFELGLLSSLVEIPGMKALEGSVPGETTLVIQYRAAGLSVGSLVARAGTAAANSLLPVGVIPEIGGGDLAMETTFLDSTGLVVGRILVQADVHGLLNTDSIAMRRIGEWTAEYVRTRFVGSGALGAKAGKKAVVINVSPEEARERLSVFEPLIGEWDLSVEFRLPEAAPIHLKGRESNRWEAGGRVLFQDTETQGDVETRFRCNMAIWNPVTQRIEFSTLDSSFGAHMSQQVSVEREGRVLKLVAAEKDRVIESVETFSEDGLSRRLTRTYWDGDRSRVLLTILIDSVRRGSPAK